MFCLTKALLSFIKKRKIIQLPWQVLYQIQGGNALTNSPSAIPEITLPLIPEPVKNLEKMPKEDSPLL